MMRSFLLTKVKFTTAAVLACVLLGSGVYSLVPALHADGNKGAQVKNQAPSGPGSPKPAAQARQAKKPAVALRQESLELWGKSEIIIAAKLTKVQQGPVTNSIPPIYSHQLHFTVNKVLRGALKKGEEIKASHSVRQDNAPTFPEGKNCLVGLSKVRGMWLAQAVREAKAADVAQAELACKVPAGWSMEKGRLVSPWARLGNDAWPAAAKGKGPFTCAVTGRPALLAGEGVQLSVEVVPPKVKLKYGNPDGDGEFRVTVKNATKKPVSIPALLSDGNKVLWNESLVILCQGKVYLLPGAEKVKRAPRPTVLPPGKAISTVVNVLRLKGPEWPRGGYRIEFLFALGEKNVTHSFYYLSRHHDPLREKLSAGKQEKKE
jgi:hypothetical protein